MAQASNLRGIIFMLLSGFTFVLNDSMLKLAMQDLPPYEVLVMRGLSGVLFALVMLAMNGELHFIAGGPSTGGNEAQVRDHGVALAGDAAIHDAAEIVVD